jgi:excisionase family DNA binding protein
MPLLTITAAATQLATSRRTIEREIADGKLAVIRVRGSRRVAQADLDSYIARQRRGEQWQSTSAATGGTTGSKSAADRSRAALEQALHELRLSSSKRSAERKLQQKAAPRPLADGRMSSLASASTRKEAT